jgi:hypothetical protein
MYHLELTPKPYELVYLEFLSSYSSLLIIPPRIREMNFSDGTCMGFGDFSEDTGLKGLDSF